MGLEAFPVEMTTSFDTPGTELYTLPMSPISPLLASNMDASGRTVTVVCDESNSATSWVVVTAPNGTVTITALNTHPAFLIDPLSRCADTSMYPQNNTHSAHAWTLSPDTDPPTHLSSSRFFFPPLLLPSFGYVWLVVCVWLVVHVADGAVHLSVVLDVNGDELNDIVILYSGCSSCTRETMLSVILQSPNVPFEDWGEWTHVFGLGHSRKGDVLATGDFDGDGRPDIAAGTKQNNRNSGYKVLSVYRQLDDTGLAWSELVLRTGEAFGDDHWAHVYLLFAADLNGDGLDDLVYGFRNKGNEKPAEHGVYLATGGGAFSPPIVLPFTPQTMDGLVNTAALQPPVDFAGEGRAGFFAYHADLDEWKWVMIQDPGNPVVFSTSLSFSSDVRFMDHVDINDDGNPDLVYSLGDVSVRDSRPQGALVLNAVPFTGGVVYTNSSQFNGTYVPIFGCPSSLLDAREVNAGNRVVWPLFLPSSDTLLGSPALLALTGESVLQFAPFLGTASMVQSSALVMGSTNGTRTDGLAQLPWSAPLMVAVAPFRGIVGCDDLVAAFGSSFSWSIHAFLNVRCDGSHWVRHPTPILNASSVYSDTWRLVSIQAVPLSGSSTLPDVVVVVDNRDPEQMQVRVAHNAYHPGLGDQLAFEALASVPGLDGEIFPRTSASLSDVFFHDVDGDSILDFVVSRSHGWCSSTCINQVWLFPGTTGLPGNATFGGMREPHDTRTSDRGTNAVAVLDVTGDGLSDVCGCNNRDESIAVWVNTNVSWAYAPGVNVFYTLGKCGAFATGDVDGDGGADLVVLLLSSGETSQAKVALLLSSTLPQGGVLPPSDDAFVVVTFARDATFDGGVFVVGDVDYDGYPDLLLYSPVTSSVEWAQNVDGSGRVWHDPRPVLTFQTEQGHQTLAVGQVNKDDVLDLAVLSRVDPANADALVSCTTCNSMASMGAGIFVATLPHPGNVLTIPTPETNATTTETGPCESFTMRCIQVMINAAPRSRQVDLVIPDGVWRGCAGGSEFGLSLAGKQITLRSASGDPGSVVLDFEAQCPGLLVDSGETLFARVQGITLTRGATPGSGGCVYVGSGSSASFHSVVLSSCRALDGYGGAVFVSGSLTLENVTLSDSTARWGGGLAYQSEFSLAVTGVSVDRVTVAPQVLVNVSVVSCRAEAEGGGIYVGLDGLNPSGLAPPRLSGVILDANTATRGGGLYTTVPLHPYGSDGVPLTATRNLAWNSGGGIMLSSPTSQRSELEHDVHKVEGWVIVGNTAHARGGGVYGFRITVEVGGGGSGCVVDGNYAGSEGGGMALDDCKVQSFGGGGGEMTATGMAMWVRGNTAVERGGGIAVSSSGPVGVTLSRLEVSGNVGGIAGGGVFVTGTGVALEMGNTTVSDNRLDRALATSDLTTLLLGAGMAVECPLGSKVAGTCLTGNGVVVLLTGRTVFVGNTVYDSNSGGGGVSVAGRLTFGREVVFDANVAGKGGALYWDGVHGFVEGEGGGRIEGGSAVTAGGAVFICVVRCGHHVSGVPPVGSDLMVGLSGVVIGTSSAGLYGNMRATDAVSMSVMTGVDGSDRVVSVRSGSSAPVVRGVLVDAFGQKVNADVSLEAVLRPRGDSVGVVEFVLLGSKVVSGDDKGEARFADLGPAMAVESLEVATSRLAWPAELLIQSTYSASLSVSLPIEVTMCSESSRSVSAAGALVCRDCVRGEVLESGECVLCGVGMSSNRSNAESCAPCPPGTFAASEGLSECATCAVGTYALKEGSDSCGVCESARASCVADAVSPLPGYYMAVRRDGRAVFATCSRQVCLGGNTCAWPRTGLMCGMCREGYEMGSSRKCIRCPNDGGSASGVNGNWIGVGLVVYASMALFCLLLRVSTSALSKILVFFVQILAIILTDAPSGAPDLSLFLFDVETTLGQCFGQVGFYGRFWMALLVPVAVSIWILVLFAPVHYVLSLLSRAMPRVMAKASRVIDSSSPWKDRLIKALLVSILFTYTPTMRAILDVFSCESTFPDTEMRVLRADNSIQCVREDGGVDPSYRFYFGIAMVCTVLYVYAVPFLLGGLMLVLSKRGLLRATATATRDDRLATVERRFGALFMHIEGRKELWFEPFLQLRKALLVSIVSFSPDRDGRLFGLSTALVVILAIQIHFSPYRTQWHNRLSALLLLVLVVVVSTLRWLGDRAQGGSDAEFGMLVKVVVAIVALPVLVFVGEVVVSRSRWRRTRVGGGTQRRGNGVGGKGKPSSVLPMSIPSLFGASSGRAGGRGGGRWSLSDEDDSSSSASYSSGTSASAQTVH